MNKKGFTLVELITTIVILGVIITIAIVSVGRILQKTHKSYDEKQRDLFELAAQEYFTDNKSLLPKINNGTKEITLQELIGNKYIGKIINSKGEECDLDGSIVRVTRKGVNKYVYESVLICGENTELGKLKEIKNGNATITLYHDGKRYKYIDNVGTGTLTYTKLLVTNNTYYYVNASQESYVEAHISDSTGISSYRYEIYRKDSSNKFKLYKSSEQIMLGNVVKSKNDIRIEVDSKTLKDGAYKVKVISINKDGYESKSNYSDVVVIDTKKPRCSIGLSGTEGEINGVKTGWYTKADVKLTIKITDANKYQLKYTNNANENDKLTVPQQSSYTSYTTKTKELSLTASNIDGVLYIANVLDKAFNEGSCNNNNKPIRIDTTEPECSVSINYTGTGTEAKGDDGKIWTNRNVQGVGTCTNNSGASGCYKNEEKTAIISAVDNKVIEDEFRGIVVYSGAGKAKMCSNIDYHIDRVAPSCNVRGGSATWLNAVNIKNGLKRTITAICNDKVNNVQGVGCGAGELAGFAKDYKTDINTTKAGARGDNNGGYVEDKLGNRTDCSADQTVRIDTVPPKCKESAQYPDDNNEYQAYTDGTWVKHNVVVTHTCSDDASGCNKSTKASKTIQKKSGEYGEFKDVKAVNSFFDNAGNEGSCTGINVKIDKAKPSCDFTPSGTEGELDGVKTGWYTSAIGITTNFYDNDKKYSDTDTITIDDFGMVKTTGKKTDNEPAYNRATFDTISGDGSDKRAYCYVKDKAGNTGMNIAYYKVDKTPPEISGWCIANVDSSNSKRKYGFLANSGGENIRSEHGLFIVFYDEVSGLKNGPYNKTDFHVNVAGLGATVWNDLDGHKQHHYYSTGNFDLRSGSYDKDDLSKGHYIYYDEFYDQAGNKQPGLHDTKKEANNINTNKEINSDNSSFKNCTEYIDTHGCYKKVGNTYMCYQPLYEYDANGNMKTKTVSVSE